MSQHPKINIVIPVYNEQDSLSTLYAAIAEAMRDVPVRWYVTFVNDGSSDNSLSVLHDIRRQYNHVRIVSLARNFGKEIALSAGLDSNTADAVIMMDSDLQHPPGYIAEFVRLWRAGSQVVVGVRTEEGTDSLIKIYGSRMFYSLINKVSDVKIVPRATDFRLLDAEVVDAFKGMPEHNRITRGMIDWLGYDRTYVPFAAAERHAGEATYTLGKLFKLAFDSFVSMTLLPLRVSIYVGFALIVVFGPLGLFMFVSKYFLGDRYDFSGPATLAVLIILLVAIILINIGFVGMYIAAIRDQVRGRPLYVVNKKYSSGAATPPQQSPVSVHATHDVASVSEVLKNHGQASLQGHGVAAAPLTPQQSRQAAQAQGHTSKKIVWLTWKDTHHPQAGGAELLQHALCRRLAQDGHDVTVITSRPKGLSARQEHDGYRIERKGNRYTVYIHAWRQFVRGHKHTTDIVIEEVNTVPFFSRWYTPKRTQSVLFFHQLARQIWFHEYFPPLNLIGYLIEPLYLRFANHTHRQDDRAITVSRSSKIDLIKNGFDPASTHVISEAVDIQSLSDPSHAQKLPVPSILAYGGIRSMKRTLHVLQAFEQAKKQIPNLMLTIAGDGSGRYARNVKLAVKTSPYRRDITVTGRVREQDKPGLLASHHFLVSTAVKEGWGLTITEAASQGTPAIVYDVDGQRDAVFHGAAGILVRPEVEALSRTIVRAFAPSFDYKKLQTDAWLHAQSVHVDNSYKDFAHTINVRD